MDIKKFKIYLKTQFVGFIFISDNHPDYPNCKVGTIWPFISQGSWTENNLEWIGQNLINDLFDKNESDTSIQQRLAKQVDSYQNNINELKFQSYN